MRFPCILLIPFALPAAAQLPDLDDFGGDLDLAPPPPPTEERPPEPDERPRTMIFDIPDALAEVNRAFLPSDDATPWRLGLPKATYLVVPNPGTLEVAYQKLAAAVHGEAFTPLAPLKIVLHADGNFSVAVRVAFEGAPDLPPGVDLSPQPEIQLAGRVADIQLVEKSHPLVLNAYVETRNRAKAEGLRLDTNEFLFLPIAPGQVFFGLEISE